MSNLAKLEKEVLDLPPGEREQLALSAWESLGDGSDEAICTVLDPEGVNLARKRDDELSAGAVTPMGHAEFVRRTSGHPPHLTWLRQT